VNQNMATIVPKMMPSVVSSTTTMYTYIHAYIHTCIHTSMYAYIHTSTDLFREPKHGDDSAEDDAKRGVFNHNNDRYQNHQNELTSVEVVNVLHFLYVCMYVRVHTCVYVCVGHQGLKNELKPVEVVNMLHSMCACMYVCMYVCDQDHQDELTPVEVLNVLHFMYACICVCMYAIKITRMN
jgi:hypothetical protein